MPTTGQSANAIEFTFDGKNTLPDNATLTAAALAAGAQEEPTAPAATETPVELPAEATAPDATATPVDEPAATATAKAETPAESLKTHTIKVDGRELVVTEKDLLEGHMRHRDYTQKTQKLADREREFAQREEQYQRELAALDAFLRDQTAIDAYVQKAFGVSTATRPQQEAAPQPPKIDPSKPLTAQEVADIARYNAEQVRIYTERLVDTKVNEARQAAVAEAQQARQAVQIAQVESTVNAHISTLLDKYPVLKKFEDIEEVLIADAAKYQPKSVEEGKARLSEAAERRAAVIKALADEEKKASAVAAAKLKQTGTEAPGGSAVKPAPGKRMTFDSKDRKTLQDAAIADVQAFLNS